MARPIRFTVEDLKHNGTVDADKLERVLRQFQQAIGTPVALSTTATGPVATAVASGEPIDLEALSKQVAALVKPQLEATGSSPINTSNLLGEPTLPATFVGYGDSANKLTGSPDLIHSDTFGLNIASITGANHWNLWSGDDRSVLNPTWDFSYEAMSEFVFHKTSTQVKKTALTIHTEASIVDASDARVISAVVLARSTHPSGNQNQVIALYPEAVNVGNGDSAELDGVLSYCQNAGGGVIGVASAFTGSVENMGSGHITDVKTLWVQPNSGTITNNYGIFCNPQGAGTHNYTIWSGELLSSFGAVLQTYVLDVCDVAILTHNRVSALSVIEDSNTIGTGSNREVILVAGESTNASGTKNQNVGIVSDTYHTGAGTVTELYGLYGTWETDAGTATLAAGLAVGGGGGSGHTVDGCGIDVKTNVGPGTIDRNYGIRIDAQLAGTKNWNIYSGQPVSAFSALVQSYIDGNITANAFATIDQIDTLSVANTNSGTANREALLVVAESTNSSGTKGHMIAGVFDTYHRTAGGTVGALLGMTGTWEVDAGTATFAAGGMFIGGGGSGSCTNGIGVWIQGLVGPGTITNAYGLKIDDQVYGSTVWSLFTGTGKVSFGDQVNIRGGKTLNIESGGSTTISTGAGSVKMSTTNPAGNAAWIPIMYAGTTYYVPAWTTNAP